MTAPVQSDSAAEDPLDALLIECMERLEQGDANAIEAACATAPEHAAEIRERLGLLLQIGVVKGVQPSEAFPDRLDQFRLVRRLGGGGMGVVYEAEQEPIGRTVALKLIRPEHLYFPRARERFRRETEAVAKLQHPGIVSIFTVGEAAGVPYFAMEKLAGATLAEVLSHVAGLAPERLRGRDLRSALGLASEPATAEAQELFHGSWVDACTRIAARVADALAHAHSRGVLHRDVKPSNIVVTPDGRVVLLDFGLASSQSELRMTVSGSAVGSVLYMAPEQVKGRADEIDERTDVYSLGVTLYELVTLQVPFIGDDAEQARTAILDGRPASMRARNRSVSRDLEVVCTTAIDCDRARRYPSMEQFASDLRNVLQHRSIVARPPGAALRTARWVQRNPTASVALCAAFLLIVGVPLALLWQQHGHSAELERALAAQTAARLAADEASARVATEKERAELEAHSAETVATFLGDLFRAADPNRSRGREITARDLLQRGVERIDAHLGDQPEIQARLLDQLGQSFTNLDLYADALPLAERALELQCALPGVEGVRTAQMLMSLGKVRRLLGRADSIESLRRARDIYSDCHGREHRLVLQCEAELAIALIEQGQAPAARELLARASAIQELNHPHDLELREKLKGAEIFAYASVRDYERTEVAAREAIELAFEVYRGPHPAIVSDMNGLANALLGQNRLEEADEVFGDLLALARIVYGEQSATYTMTRMNRAVLLEQQGRFKEAESDYRESLAWMRANLGDEHPNSVRCLGNLTHVLTRLARYREAIEVATPVLDVVRTRLGPNDERTLLIAYRVAQGYEALGEFERVEELLQRALDDADTSDPRRIAWIQIALAGSLRHSSTTLDAARGMLERLNGRCVPLLQRQVLHHLVCMELERGDGYAADMWLERASGLPEPTPGDGWAPASLQALDGARAIARGELERGEQDLSAGLDELERQLGARHATFQEVVEFAAQAWTEAGMRERAAELRAALAVVR